MVDLTDEGDDQGKSPSFLGFRIPQEEITDPLEIGAFCAGSTATFVLTFIVTGGDYETSSLMAPIGGGFCFGLKRLLEGWLRFGSGRSTEKLKARVRWEVGRLFNARAERMLTPLETERLSELEAIYSQELWEPDLMRDVLKRTKQSARKARRALQPAPESRHGSV